MFVYISISIKQIECELRGRSSLRFVSKVIILSIAAAVLWSISWQIHCKQIVPYLTKKINVIYML